MNIQKFSGDLETIMYYLWNDRRVDSLVQRDWQHLNGLVEAKSTEVSRAIHNFCGLLKDNSEEAVLRYLDTLPEDIMDCLLVELARELHFLKENEGVVLH